MSRAFIAVASADHVGRGVAGGFMQVNHGKAAPLRRIQAGDRVAYYSPTPVYGDKTPLRAFTAFGVVAEGEMRQVAMSGDFKPWRRPVRWLLGHAAAIAPLLGRLAFTSGSRTWGARLRFGLLEIGEGDLEIIGEAMGIVLPAEPDAACAAAPGRGVRSGGGQSTMHLGRIALRP